MDVCARLSLVSARTQGLATAAMLRDAGASRSALARAVAAGRLVRPLPRLYSHEALPERPRWVVTDLGVDPTFVARVRAVLMSHGPSYAASGRTAAALHGWPMLVEPARTLQLTVPHGFGSVADPALRVQQRRAAAVDRYTLIAGTEPLLLTTPVQTVLDCARALSLLEAVTICDSALRAGSVGLDELACAIRSLRGTADVGRMRRVLAEADPASGSVLESAARVRLRIGGVSTLRTQVTLAVSPLPVRVDFCDEEARVVVEVDGTRWHPDPARDQRRDNLLAQLGFRVLRFTWSQVIHDHRSFVAQVTDTLAATGTLHAGPGRCGEARAAGGAARLEGRRRTPSSSARSL